MESIAASGGAKYENESTYNGESYNPNIQSRYLRTRYYDVTAARFLTEDTFLGATASPLTWNRYGYCVGNSMNYRDAGGDIARWGKKVVGFFKGAGGKVSNFFTHTVLSKLDDLGKWAKGLDAVDEAMDAARAAGGTLDELDDIGQEIAEKAAKADNLPARKDPGSAGGVGAAGGSGGSETLLDKSPAEISNMTRKQLEESVPEGWKFYNHNGRIHIKDENNNIRIRIDPPDDRVNYTHIHISDENRNPLDINGNIVSPTAPSGHIPYND